MTTKRCIPVKTTLDRSAVVFCACEVVSYVVRAVPKSKFRLLINGTPNKWRTVCSKKKLRHAVTKSHIFDGIYILRDATHAAQVKCILVSKGHHKDTNVSDTFAAYIIRIVQEM